MNSFETKIGSNKGLGFLLQALWDSFLSRTQKNSSGLSRKTVERFFAEYGEEKDSVEIFDSESSDYERLLLHKEEFLPSIRILDVGCGNGNLVKILHSAGFSFSSYEGVDIHTEFAEKAVLEIEKAHVTRTDFLEFSGSQKYDHVFFINSLTYMPDLGSVVSKLRELVTGQPALVTIIEPYPSILWEKQFFNVEPKYRHPKEIASRFEEIGFRKVGNTTLYFRVLDGFGVIPLSYKLNFQVSMSNGAQ